MLKHHVKHVEKNYEKLHSWAAAVSLVGWDCLGLVRLQGMPHFLHRYRLSFRDAEGKRAGCSAAAATAATGALGAVFPTFPTGWEEAPAVAGRSSFELGRSWSSWTLMLR